MISISRNFKILIIDDNETDLKVVQRLISKDYKSIDVTARSGVTDWKIFLEGNKFDMILLNYAAGSSVGLQEIKKIIAVNDNIPVYIMIWQHEVEVGMKAIYQGAEGFVIKDKTYLNLKKVIQRSLINYLIYSELNSMREINDIISEEVNDGFFRFTKEGDLEYISDKFGSELGYDTDFETGTIFSNLYKEIKEHIKNGDDYEKETSFLFETTGKDSKPFWFQVYVYKKIDLRNDTLYYEGVLKNISEAKALESVIKTLKDEKELLLNSSPLPVEVYSKEGKKISSNPAFTKMLSGIDVSLKDPIAKTPEAQTLKDNVLKTAETGALNSNNQKITLGNKEKYFDINYVASKENPDSVFAFYNDISENVKYRKILAEANNKRNALYNSVETGFIELDAEGQIIDISDKALVILGKGINEYSGTPLIDVFSGANVNLIKTALTEAKKSGYYSFTTADFIKFSFQIIKSSSGEISGYIAAVDNIAKFIETEEAYKSNADKVAAFSNIENIFLWTGYLSSGNIKAEFCSKSVENITGYSIDEALDAESELTSIIFDLKENSSKDKLLKCLKENCEQEKNFTDKKGKVKRLKINITLQKESKDSYKINALVEDITKLTKRNSFYAGIISSTSNSLNSDNSAFFKIDEKITVQEIFQASPRFSKEIALGNTIQELGGIQTNIICGELEKAIRENLNSDIILESDNEQKRKYKITMTHYIDFAGNKSLYVYIKDITDIECLRNDFAYLSKITESMQNFNAPLMFITENEKITVSNSGIENLTGYKKEELENKTLQELFFDESEYEDYLKHVKQLKKKNHIEFSIKLKDKSNSAKYCRFDCSLIQTNDSIEKILFVGKDESVIENLNIELKYKTELERIISSSSDDAVIAWDSNSVIYKNNAMDSLFGYSEKELSAIDKRELFAPIQEEAAKDIINKIFEGEYQDFGKPFEVICKKKHGQEFYAEAVITQSQLITNNVSILSISDITERKHLEKALYNIDTRFRGVIDSLNEGIWLFDGEYKTVFISQRALTYLDYTIDEILEKRIFYFIKDSKFEFDKRYFEESAGAKYSNLNLSFIRKNNDIFNSKVNIIPIKDEKGSFLGGILSLTDTSEIIIRENEISNLKEKNGALEKKIKSLDSDLMEARKLITDYKKASENLILELEEKINSSKSLVEKLDTTNSHINRLYSAVQHNLRGQINNISSFAEFVEQVWNNISPSQQEAYIKILLSNSKQAFRIFDKISLLSKYASGTIKIKPGIVNISSKIEKIISDKKEKCAAKNITIESEIKDTIQVLGDYKLLEFAIDEIINNAIKFSNSNGNIKIFLQPVHDKISLTILDNGVGINAEKLNRIFDFNLAYPVHSSNGNFQSGLSLLIIKEIIKSHNGAIEISSEDGKGTKVHIILPSASSDVFLIGSETDCEIMKNFISRNSGFNSESFFETENALNLISSGLNPCAIFVTYSQPEEKFFGFLDKLKNIPASNTLPVVAMSSDSSDEFKARLLKCGISTLISLPLNENSIFSAFENIVHN